MVEPLQACINGASISLEIVGFILMLKANKKTIMVEGGQAVPHAMKEVLEPPNLNRFKNGIALVIAGLVGQIIAMFA